MSNNVGVGVGLFMLVLIILMILFVPFVSLWIINTLIIRPCGGEALAYSLLSVQWWAALLSSGMLGGMFGGMLNRN